MGTTVLVACHCFASPAIDYQSRDQKAFEAERQQEDAKRQQEQQAAIKEMIKAQREAERASTMDPGRKAQLTQEINKLQDEITRHELQAQALDDTSNKANYAGKQSEAGNAKKGSQAQGTLDRNGGPDGPISASGGGTTRRLARVPTLYEAAGIGSPTSPDVALAALTEVGSSPEGPGESPTSTLVPNEGQPETQAGDNGRRRLVEKPLKALDAQISSLPSTGFATSRSLASASLSSSVDYLNVPFGPLEEELESRAKALKKRIASGGEAAGPGGGLSGAAQGRSLLDTLRLANASLSGHEADAERDRWESGADGVTVLVGADGAEADSFAHGLVGGSTRTRKFRTAKALASRPVPAVGPIASGLLPRGK